MVLNVFPFFDWISIMYGVPADNSLAVNSEISALTSPYFKISLLLLLMSLILVPSISTPIGGDQVNVTSVSVISVILRFLGGLMPAVCEKEI